MNEQIES